MTGKRRRSPTSGSKSRQVPRSKAVACLLEPECINFPLRVCGLRYRWRRKLPDTLAWIPQTIEKLYTYLRPSGYGKLARPVQKHSLGIVHVVLFPQVFSTDIGTRKARRL